MKKIRCFPCLALAIVIGCSSGDSLEMEQTDTRKDTKIITLKEAAGRLAELSNSQIRSYSTYNFGRSQDPNSLSAVLSEDKALPLVESMRGELDSSLQCFIGTTRWLGDEEHDGVEVVVAKGVNQFDIVRVARSDGINYGLQTEDLVSKLVDYDKEYGIEIFHAESDTIQFKFLNLPDDLTAFCEDLYKFCPDIVDQGAGTLDILEQEIRTNKSVYLWWD